MSSVCPKYNVLFSASFLTILLISGETNGKIRDFSYVREKKTRGRAELEVDFFSLFRKTWLNCRSLWLTERVTWTCWGSVRPLSSGRLSHIRFPAGTVNCRLFWLKFFLRNCNTGISFESICSAISYCQCQEG